MQFRLEVKMEDLAEVLKDFEETVSISRSADADKVYIHFDKGSYELKNYVLHRGNERKINVLWKEDFPITDREQYAIVEAFRRKSFAKGFLKNAVKVREAGTSISQDSIVGVIDIELVPDACSLADSSLDWDKDNDTCIEWEK